MLTLCSNKLQLQIDEQNGGDIVSLKTLDDNIEFVRRRGIQGWIKSGEKLDPASGVLGNYYAGVESPLFETAAQTRSMTMLKTRLQDLEITKTIEIIENSVTVEIVLENIAGTEKAIPVQIENFCNLAGAEAEARENTITFLANDNLIPYSPVYLEKFSQRYVRSFKHNRESIIIAGADKRHYLEIGVRKKAEALALVIHANRLCWGINGQKKVLSNGESTAFSISFTVHHQPARKRFNLPEKPAAKKTSGTDFDAIFNGDPAFTGRWSHLCLQYDKVNEDDLRKVIAGLLAPMKYNGVVFELNRGVRLKSHPELAADFAMDINALKSITAFARAHGLKVGVEFNTPGHQNETGIPEAYPEFMEPKPDNIPGSVLCVSNPGVRSLIKDIIMELQEAIEPEMLNIGADEVQFAGYSGTPFGHCSRCAKQNPEELFSGYLEWVQTLIKSGVTPAIYGDMFLQFRQFGDRVGGNGSEGNLWKSISALHSNTIILDWHYYPADEYRSLDYFRGMGYETWALTAFSFEGMRNFLLYAENTGVKQAMHTTWSVPCKEKLFIETMFWAGCYHWLGKKAVGMDVKAAGLDFCRNFWQ